MPNLYAQEIDADKRIKAYQEEIRKKIFDMYGFDKIRTRSRATPGGRGRARHGGERDLRRGRGIVCRKYDYYIYDLVPWPRPVLPEHGQCVRRVD